ATLNYGDGVAQTIRDALRQSTVLGSVVEARTPHSPLFGAVRSQLISVRGDARAYLVAFDPIERHSAS
ncbi:MAG: hypothetical protein LIV29_04940, partial [Denitrobacterium sp.]|nr:hypothetical protein [Denitrobacterium sp.]